MIRPLPFLIGPVHATLLAFVCPSSLHFSHIWLPMFSDSVHVLVPVLVCLSMGPRHPTAHSRIPVLYFLTERYLLRGSFSPRTSCSDVSAHHSASPRMEPRVSSVQFGCPVGCMDYLWANFLSKGIIYGLGYRTSFIPLVNYAPVQYLNPIDSIFGTIIGVV